MPRGYWIASLDVTDVDAYKKYVEANAEAFGKYEGKFLTRGGPFTQLEGKQRSRNCIVEFKDVDTALACYNSPEYQRALALRSNIAEADIIIMAGYDGPQPPELPGDKASVADMYVVHSYDAKIKQSLYVPAWLKRELLEHCIDDLTASCQS